MATVRFNCPNCGALIAFDSRHAGRHAHCTACQQHFIIPQKDRETPKKLEPRAEKAEPIPGFFLAALIESWKIFINPKNKATLAFIISVVCFNFFLAHSFCIGLIAHVVIWGWLLGFYLNVIYETAFDVDELPEIYLGDFVGFFWQIVKPFAIFFFTMIVVQAPLIVALLLLKDKGFSYETIWQSRAGFNLLLQGLFVLGIVLFPSAILTIAIGRDIMLLRPDYLAAPLVRAFCPYILTTLLLVAAGLLESCTRQFRFAAPITTVLDLLLNLAVQVVAVIAMRSIGLLYRHYSCRFKW